MLFAIIETVHVLGIALLAGTAAILDLRLLGIGLAEKKVSEVAGQIERLAWWGLAVMCVSGFLLFWSEAANSYIVVAGKSAPDGSN